MERVRVILVHSVQNEAPGIALADDYECHLASLDVILARFQGPGEQDFDILIIDAADGAAAIRLMLWCETKKVPFLLCVGAEDSPHVVGVFRDRDYNNEWLIERCSIDYLAQIDTAIHYWGIVGWPTGSCRSIS